MEWNKYTMQALEIISEFFIDMYNEDEDKAPLIAAILVKRLYKDGHIPYRIPDTNGHPQGG